MKIQLLTALFASLTLVSCDDRAGQPLASSNRTAPAYIPSRECEPETPLYEAFVAAKASKRSGGDKELHPVFIYRGVRFIGCGAELRESGNRYVVTAAHLLYEPVPSVYSYRLLENLEIEIPVSEACLPFGASDVAILFPGPSTPIRGIACKIGMKSDGVKSSVECSSTLSGANGTLKYNESAASESGTPVRGILRARQIIGPGESGTVWEVNSERLFLLQGHQGEPRFLERPRNLFGVVIDKKNLMEIASSPISRTQARLLQLGAVLESGINAQYGRLPMIHDEIRRQPRSEIDLAGISANVLLLNLINAKLNQLGFDDYCLNDSTRLSWIGLRISMGDMDVAADHISRGMENSQELEFYLWQGLVDYLKGDKDKAALMFLWLTKIPEEICDPAIEELALSNLIAMYDSKRHSPLVDAVVHGTRARDLWWRKFRKIASAKIRDDSTSETHP